jgi:hypothetical protein
VKQGNDGAIFWCERLEQGAQEFATFLGGGVPCGLLEERFCGALGVLGEIAPAVFRATGFRAKGVETDVEAEAGDPVFKWTRRLVAVEVFEELNEYVLDEVFGGGASREMIGNNAVDLGVECFDEPRCGGFVPRGFPSNEVMLKRGAHVGVVGLLQIHRIRRAVTAGLCARLSSPVKKESISA